MLPRESTTPASAGSGLPGLAVAELAVAELAVAELAVAELVVAELAVVELAVAELDVATACQEEEAVAAVAASLKGEAVAFWAL